MNESKFKFSSMKLCKVFFSALFFLLCSFLIYQLNIFQSKMSISVADLRGQPT